MREGILTSEPVNSLTWPAEVFYRRLLSVVDDFGRYYAKAALIRAHCYPLKLEVVSDSDIGKWLTECVNAALVRVYPASDGKRYLEVLKFDQRARAKDSKFPAFVDGLTDGCTTPDGQTSDKRRTSAPVVVVEDVVVSVVGKNHAAAPLGVDPTTWKAWVKQKGKTQTVKADELQRKHLAEWAEQGHDVNRIVEDAVAGHWDGLHAPRANPRTQSLRERGVSNIDRITGQGNGHATRTINGSTERVDRAALPAVPHDLRQPARDDVDRDRPGRPDDDVET